MKQSELKCAICGGKLLKKENSEEYLCAECSASHDSTIFQDTNSKSSKKGIALKLNLFVAIIGALYLLWLAYRIFIY